MKIDNYTKVLLTVIAGCLTVLTLQKTDLIPKAKADEGLLPENEKGVKYGLVPLTKDGAVKVRISRPAEMMDINIERVGGSSVFGGNFPVSIEDIRDQPIEIESR